MIFNFMSDGQVISTVNPPFSRTLNVHRRIPIVYYGQEQGFRGNADPVKQPFNFSFTFFLPETNPMSFKVEPRTAMALWICQYHHIPTNVVDEPGSLTASVTMNFIVTHLLSVSELFGQHHRLGEFLHAGPHFYQ